MKSMKTLFRVAVIVLVIPCTLIITSCGDDDPTCSDGIRNGTETGIDSGGDCGLSLFGTYEGEYVAKRDTGTAAIDTMVSINIANCEDDCMEITIQHASGFTVTSGTYSLSGTVYSLKVMSTIGEAEYPGGALPMPDDGVGTFDIINNDLIMSFEVTDESGIWSSNHIATIQGIQN